MMTDLAALQRRVVAWHAARWPTATAPVVALKTASEVGEFGDAVIASLGGLGGKGDVGGEAADVFIALMACLGRWYPEVDFAAEVDRKMTKLETPGAHKSSAVAARPDCGDGCTGCTECFPHVGLEPR